MTDPGRFLAEERIEDLLRELADIIGPTIEDNIDVEGDCLLSEWCLVTGWIDEGGASWVCTQTPENMPGHHRVGLLRTSLGD